MRKLIENYHDDIIRSFKSYKKLAERALAQVSDEDFFRISGEQDNSIAVIVKHISGNQRSRFTDFLTTDGEKPDRFRDSEFVVEAETREQLMLNWENGWRILFGSLEPLKPSDFEKTITIRQEEHTVIEAINRQLTHYAYHIGQIAFIARHLRASGWETLSVARDQSDAFNEFMRDREDKPDRHAIDGPVEFTALISKKGEL
jgi:hypothetical protein